MAVLTVVVGCVGCSTPTGPDDSPSVNLQVAHSGSNGAPAGATFPPTILAQENGIIVLGLMTTPDPCQTISASGSRSGSQVTIRLTARRVGQLCVQVVGEFAYRATMPLPPGTYTVEVVHEHPGTGWPTNVVRTATVVVQ